MEIPLQTFEVWEYDGEATPRDLLEALSILLSPQDIVIFGCYEPTERLTQALLQVGAKQHSEMKEFYSSFEVNRSENPNGCAFELALGDTFFSDVLSIPEDTLKQKDIPSFYDHILAYRPGAPRVPLFTFHDAACGGTLYLSGLYTQKEAVDFAKKLGGKCFETRNPIFKNYKYVEKDR